MKRKIIKIDEEKCSGCGACASACHEGAIGMVNGKAKLLREHFCDGLGDCLPACPTGAITFEEREAPAYDEEAVRAEKLKTFAAARGACPSGGAHPAGGHAHPAGGCPGSRMAQFARGAHGAEQTGAANTAAQQSELTHWPVQIKLVPVKAPFFDGAKLLIAADCTAFAYGAFHSRFLKNHALVVGCPKLDGVDYTEKLAAILRENDIRSMTVLRMEVPCCGGLENAAKAALQQSGKFIPWQVHTVSIDGRLLDE